MSALFCVYILGLSPTRFDNPILTAFDVKKPEIVGFLPYWLIDKADKNYSQYITTLTYFGLTVQNDGSIQKLASAQEEEPGWTTLNGNKLNTFMDSKNTKYLKRSLLVVSGDDDAIRKMITDPVQSATNLINDVAPIMKEKQFTDLNLDIETFMEASESARNNFTTFVSTVHTMVHQQKLGTLTIDLIPIALVKDKLYDMKSLGTIVDRVVLMTYDYHYSGSFTSGANAPVSGAGTTIEFDTETAVKEALKIMPREKILLGIPLYGYEWETLDEATESATIPGGSSTASVRRVTEMLSSCASCSASFDPVAKEPYVVIPENDYYNQIYFENEASMKEKIHMAQTYHLGGVAFWALGYEDDTMLRPFTTYKNSLDLSGMY
jgi:spore germination protein YaaH